MGRISPHGHSFPVCESAAYSFKTNQMNFLFLPPCSSTSSPNFLLCRSPFTTWPEPPLAPPTAPSTPSWMTSPHRAPLTNTLGFLVHQEMRPPPLCRSATGTSKYGVPLKQACCRLEDYLEEIIMFGLVQYWLSSSLSVSFVICRKSASISLVWPMR